MTNLWDFRAKITQAVVLLTSDSSLFLLDLLQECFGAEIREMQKNIKTPKYGTDSSGIIA